MKKNNKLVYGFTGIAATVLMALAPVAGVFAATPNTLNSTAQVEVLEGGTPTNPNNPEEKIPDGPDLPDTVGKTGEDLLQLVAVPDLRFKDTSATDLETADQKLDYADTVVENGTNADNTDAHLTVSDYRGTLAGWKLSAGLTNFKNIDDSSSADLTGSIHLQSEGKGEGTVGASDKVFLDRDTEGGYAFLTNTGVDLKTGDTDTQILNAEPGEGMGMTIAQMTASQLKLNKEAGAKKGTYQADITWTLSSTAATSAAGEGTETPAGE